MLRRILATGAVLGAFGALAVASDVHAVDLERLMMPGPVSQLHAETENECSKCHSPFDETREPALCMFCHEEVAADRKSRSGFHGRDRGASGLACRSCHTEHKGREQDILGLDPHSFDHSMTDYPLEGAHRALTCESCHPTDGKTKHREAPSDCYACHEKDDRHEDRLGKTCGDCHSEETWAAGKFDHSKTEYPLTGKHEEVACGRCHPNEKYKGVPTQCIDCHRLDDTHRGSFGNDCKSCHTTKSFKDSATYDPGKETKFPLKGRHEKIKCESCHREPAEEVKLPTECNDCHQISDSHRGLLGPKCGDCHDTTKWKRSTFDHDKSTRFPIAGAHEKVDCVGCHRVAPSEEPTLATCNTCHEGDDVHRGQLSGTCDRCHNEKSWTAKVFFEHDLTRFPLLGMHAVATCEDCHSSPRFHDAKIDCVKCHEKDDTHERSLGKGCERCHNPNSWKIWKFDHDAETQFPLAGAHDGLQCNACHDEPAGSEVRTSKACHACHSREDTHRGRFGRNCQACHTDESWEKTRAMR